MDSGANESGAMTIESGDKEATATGESETTTWDKEATASGDRRLGVHGEDEERRGKRASERNER